MTSATKAPNAANAGTVSFGDLTVNRLGFGAMRITGDGIWGEPNDPAEARRVLERAVELGVTLIDTADSYGPEVSERLIGEMLAPYKKGLSLRRRAATRARDRTSGSRICSRSICATALEGSLRRLKLDRIDVYQLHNAADHSVKLADAIGELAIMQSEGKIRHIGVSNFSVAQLTEARSLVNGRLGAESLQPRRSRIGGGAEGVRELQHPVPAVGAARKVEQCGDGRVGERRQTTWCDDGTDRDRRAARALTDYAADSGDVACCAPGGERRGGGDRAHGQGSKGAVAHRLTLSLRPALLPFSAFPEHDTSPDEADRRARPSRPARGICARP